MDQPMSDLAAPDLTAPSLSGVAPCYNGNPIKTVSVCGLGKLGACIAATLGARGFEVVGVDIDQEKVKKINEGLAPLDEPLLAEAIRAGHSRLRATLDPRETVATDAKTLTAVFEHLRHKRELVEASTLVERPEDLFLAQDLYPIACTRFHANVLSSPER